MLKRLLALCLLSLCFKSYLVRLSCPRDTQLAWLQWRDFLKTPMPIVLHLSIRLNTNFDTFISLSLLLILLLLNRPFAHFQHPMHTHHWNLDISRIIIHDNQHTIITNSTCPRAPLYQMQKQRHYQVSSLSLYLSPLPFQSVLVAYTNDLFLLSLNIHSLSLLYLPFSHNTINR